MPIRKTARSEETLLGKKGKEKKAAELLLKAIANKSEAVICRAPEFGPGKTKD
jgi:hypothetical protein